MQLCYANEWHLYFDLDILIDVELLPLCRSNEAKEKNTCISVNILDRNRVGGYAKLLKKLFI